MGWSDNNTMMLRKAKEADSLNTSIDSAQINEGISSAFSSIFEPLHSPTTYHLTSSKITTIKENGDVTR